MGMLMEVNMLMFVLQDPVVGMLKEVNMLMFVL